MTPMSRRPVTPTMSRQTLIRDDLEEPLAAWVEIPGRIRKSLRDLNESDLRLRGGSEGWSIRETVHHLVEANLVASNMIIAAIATNGCDYDWTWINPDKS